MAARKAKSSQRPPWERKNGARSCPEEDDDAEAHHDEEG
jgi:hypothetical protein